MTPIDTATNTAGTPITVGSSPFGVAIVPDQPPLASFSITTARARPGVPVSFNASASSDPDGPIASYAWAFGDGQTASVGPATATPTPTRLLPSDADRQRRRRLSGALVFTGQTAYCNGASSASQTQTVMVAYPGVRLKCPKSARPGGCKFKLQVVSKKRKGKAESAVAKAKAKAGRSALVSLKPKKAFATKLAVAKKVLVRETVSMQGSTRTSYPKLKIAR